MRGLWRNRRYAQGMVHYNRGRFAEAALELERAVAEIADPSNPDGSLGAFYAAEARLHLGLASLEAGELAAAEDHLRRALAANPDYPDLHLHLSTVLERRGALAEATAACRQALARNPEFRRAWVWLALLADRRDDRAERAQALARAEALGAPLPPGLPRREDRPLRGAEAAALRALEQSELSVHHAEQSLECYARGDLAGALAEVEQAIAARPGYADLRGRRAALLAELERHAEAVEEWERALAIHAGYVEARFRLALSQVALGRTAEAADAVLAVADRLPEEDGILRLASLVLLLGRRRAEASALLARAALAGHGPGAGGSECWPRPRRAPDGESHEAERLLRAAGLRDEDRSLHRAWLALGRGDLEGAARLLEEGAPAERAPFESAYERAQAERARGRPERAEEAYDEALHEAGTDGVERGLALLGRGAVRLETGKVEAALADLEQAARCLEDSAEAWLLLGRARRRAGQGEPAEEALRRAVASYPGWPEALAELADFLTRAGRSAEAEGYWERVRRVDPLHPLARTRRDAGRDAAHRAHGR
jgi:tetratricopeptide (TPR) repeat protein